MKRLFSLSLILVFVLGGIPLSSEVLSSPSECCCDHNASCAPQEEKQTDLCCPNPLPVTQIQKGCGCNHPHSQASQSNKQIFDWNLVQLVGQNSSRPLNAFETIEKFSPHSKAKDKPPRLS